MKTKIEIKNLSVCYSGSCALKKLNLTIYEHEVLAIIGPANSGKSTFLKLMNRMIDLDFESSVTGQIYIDGINILEKKQHADNIRKRIGMIFAVPIPLPMSILDNMTYPLRLNGESCKTKMLTVTENCLKAAGLWNEVKDRLHQSAMSLSGGQQQRLCLARALTINPEIILFDEPCSGLDPISTANVEKTIQELKKDYTIILVTNNTKQAARVSDRTAFFLSGDLIEIDRTDKLFTAPSLTKTRQYITVIYA